MQEFSVSLDMGLQASRCTGETLDTFRDSKCSLQGVNTGVHSDTRRPDERSKPTDPFDSEVSIIVSNLLEENDEDLKMKINILFKFGEC